MYEVSLKYLQRLSSDRADAWHCILSKGNNSKYIQRRVMTLVHDTSTDCALQMYKVSLKNL